MPRVTVLMSVFNSQRYLREAIASILRQTWTDYEFLIVNDGSTDNSREIITSFDDPRIRLVDNSTNMGLTKSLNRGLQLAQGEFIARQDADDISHPGRLEQQVGFLDAHPEVALLGTQARLIDRDEDPLIHSTGFAKPLTNVALQWHLMFDNPFIHTSVMFRREVVWGQFQGYDENFVQSQDFELWSRVAQEHEVRNSPQVLVDYRNHPQSVMAKNPSLNDQMSEGIILSNLRRFLNSREVPIDWGCLINRLRTGPKLGRIDDPDRLMEVIDTVFTRFCDLHPGAVVDQDIRRHVADQLGKIAYYSATRNRSASIRAFTRACRLDAGIMRQGIMSQIPIPKYIALWLGGEFSRRAYRRIVSG